MIIYSQVDATREVAKYGYGQSISQVKIAMYTDDRWFHVE